MIPYIVGLVFVIVMVLVGVFSQTEGFKQAALATDDTVTSSQMSCSGENSDAAAGEDLLVASGESDDVAKGKDDDDAKADMMGCMASQDGSDLDTSSLGVESPEVDMDITSAKAGLVGDSVPAAAPEGRLAKYISKEVKKDIRRELLNGRVFTNPMDMANGVDSGCAASDMTQQGTEYQNAQPFDRNDYIRKDSIPCWGCTLPA